MWKVLCSIGIFRVNIMHLPVDDGASVRNVHMKNDFFHGNILPIYIGTPHVDVPPTLSGIFKYSCEPYTAST